MEISRNRILLVFVAVAFVAGCAAGPSGKAAKPSQRPIPVKKAPGAAAKPKKAEEPLGPVAPDWESFRASGDALSKEIDRRAADLEKGPIGSKATELASLRLAAAGRDLVDAGSLDGALESLQRAVSLYGRNGYAYLWLAYVHHVQGRDDRAAEFAASARRYLPDDPKVRAELDGLTLSIRKGSAAQ